MESGTQNTLEIEKQSHKSIMLIAGIFIMTAIYMTCTHTTENEEIVLYALACPILTILLGMYTFNYRGKTYTTSRVIFFISLVISLCSIFVLWYFIELGKAYAH